MLQPVILQTRMQTNPNLAQQNHDQRTAPPAEESDQRYFECLPLS